MLDLKQSNVFNFIKNRILIKIKKFWQK